MAQPDSSNMHVSLHHIHGHLQIIFNNRELHACHKKPILHMRDSLECLADCKQYCYAMLCCQSWGFCLDRCVKFRNGGIKEMQSLVAGEGLRTVAFHPKAQDILLSAGDAKELSVHRISDSSVLQSW